MDRLEKAFGKENFENLKQDFSKAFKGEVIDFNSPYFVTLFTVFCLGTLNVLDPKSNFNTKYVLRDGPTNVTD